MIDVDAIEVWITNLQGEPVVDQKVLQPLVPEGKQVVWILGPARRGGGPTPMPDELQSGLNHVLSRVIDVYPSGDSGRAFVTMRYNFRLPDSAAVMSYSLELRMLIQRDHLGETRRVMCRLVDAVTGYTDDFLVPYQPVCTYPGLYECVEAEPFHLLRWSAPFDPVQQRPGWLTEEEARRAAAATVAGNRITGLSSTDPRYRLLTAGLPMAWRVVEAKHVLQPDQLRRFAAALVSEGVTDFARDVRLCWHGCDEDTALNILATAPNTAAARTHGGASSLGAGMYFTTNSLVSLGRGYSTPNAQGHKYLLKCLIIANKPVANKGRPHRGLPAGKNCFVDDVAQPRVYVHQHSHCIYVLGMVVVARQ